MYSKSVDASLREKFSMLKIQRNITLRPSRMIKFRGCLGFERFRLQGSSGVGLLGIALLHVSLRIWLLTVILYRF